MRQDPEQQAGTWCWSDSCGNVDVRFVGKGASADLETHLPPEVVPAWLRQVHSDHVIEARAGCCGEGDALLSRSHDLGLAIVTADCVPVLLAGREGVAAVHAGWRGIAARIVPATLARLGEPAQCVVAWVGPAIGCCCYEVGDDVAMQVAAASGPEVVSPGPRGRPHLDLTQAVAAQLESHGIHDIRRIDRCTRCSDELLWSYRREGRGAGRNLALIWRRAAGEERDGARSIREPAR